ncbi:class I SAM-dependent DNA methyltransferase [Halobacillus seohaensis]|uniref:Class I SAM-dependent DNA methyltransferase n=1 Tax=Halobacillus seohaensis TaxID=447421 RepID=A0ABW2EQG6_9BACI
MKYEGSEAYEQDDFFEKYMARRNREESPNNIIEKPIFFELMKDVRNKSVLDLGCGDGKFGRELLESGCKYYIGVDGSSNMIKESSKNLQGTAGQTEYAKLENWTFPKASYDLVTSRLVFHYIKEIAPIFEKVHDTLKDKGEFTFSVQHPILTSSLKSGAKQGVHMDWIVDNYFERGEREESWIDEKVVKYHRTLEDYFSLLIQTGFKVEELREGMPQRVYFENEEDFLRRSRIPLFLIFSCSK